MVVDRTSAPELPLMVKIYVPSGVIDLLIAENVDLALPFCGGETM